MYSQKAVLWYCKYPETTTPIDKKFHHNLDNENVSGDAVLWRHNKSKMADGRHFEDHFWRDWKFSPKNRLTMGMLPLERLLIVIVDA